MQTENKVAQNPLQASSENKMPFSQIEQTVTKKIEEGTPPKKRVTFSNLDKQKESRVASKETEKEEEGNETKG